MDSPCIRTAMAQDENILRYIPGEIIASAHHGFPPAESCKGEFREVTVDVPGRFLAKIRYEPFRDRRFGRWFWLARRAERVD
jgi:hypothetical protein